MVVLSCVSDFQVAKLATPVPMNTHQTAASRLIVAALADKLYLLTATIRTDTGFALMPWHR